MSVYDWISTAFIGLGLFFFLVGGVGILRFPDVFSRLHPAGKADTLGAALVLLGLAIHAGLGLTAVKLLFIQAFILLANPVATHAIGRAAMRAGVKPWENAE